MRYGAVSDIGVCVFQNLDTGVHHAGAHRDGLPHDLPSQPTLLRKGRLERFSGFNGLGRLEREHPPVQ